MNIVIKCLLCDQVCARLEQPEYFTLHKFECNQHPYTLHYYTTDFEEYVCHFYVEENGYRYRIRYEFSGAGLHYCDISYLTSDPPQDDGPILPKVYRKALCTFPCNPYRSNHPIITPENFKRKLPTILVFS